jgi:plasmid stability protein
MATLTIRNLPDELVERLKQSAARRSHSMEQEVRELIEARYAPRIDVLARIEERWQRLPKASAEEIRSWVREGRP